MKIKTWLPVFPRFYGTWHEPDEDMEMENIAEHRRDFGLTELPYDAIKFDYHEFGEKIAEDCVKFFEQEMAEFVKKVRYERVNSPKGYNFSNYSIYIEIELNESNRDNLIAYLVANFEAFKTYIHDRYTSYDGFLSHYNNDAEWWMDKGCLRDEHKLGAILDFVIRHKFEAEQRDVEQEMYEFAIQDNHLSASNYDECCVMEYCASCREFYKPELRKGNICPECFEANRRDYSIVCCADCGEEITSEGHKRSFIHQLKHGLIQPTEVFCDIHQLAHV